MATDADLTVRDIMTRDPIILGRNDTLDLAEDIMNLRRIRHMPVVDEGSIVGIVSQRDLFRSALVTALGFGRKTQTAVIKTSRLRKS